MKCIAAVLNMIGLTDTDNKHEMKSFYNYT